MGIQIEFNPDLALRNHNSYIQGWRMEEECLPVQMIPGQIYPFLKKGQRNYWLSGEIPLLETKGNEQLSKPLASIIILEATHHMVQEHIWTKGKYLLVRVLDPNTPYFTSYQKI